MSNRFIRDLTVGNADDRRARQIKGIENAVEAPPVTLRPRVVGGTLSGAGVLISGGGFSAAIPEAGRWQITYFVPFLGEPNVQVTPWGGTNIAGNIISSSATGFIWDGYNTGNVRTLAGFTFRAELL